MLHANTLASRFSQHILGKEKYGSLIGDGQHMLPPDIDGKRLPVLGAPIPILSSQDDDYGAPFDAINVWELSVNWTSSGNFSELVFKQSLDVEEFSSNSKFPLDFTVCTM